MKDRGKLILTTRSNAAGSKTAMCIACPVLILMGIFVMLNSRAFYAISRDHYRLIGVLLGLVLIVFAAFMLIVSLLGGRSYCDVYENSVMGMTALSRNQPNAPMQKFEIGYGDICNVTEAGKTICIYTSYALYEVLAQRNRSEAVNEIRKRISRNAK